MKNMKKIISLLLTVCTLMSMLVTFTAFEASAADETAGKDIETIVNEYITKEFKTPEEKLATMTKKLSKDGFELYVDAYTGEVATKNVATGEILFTNPYDVGTQGAVSSPSNTTPRLLSQISVTYTDNADKEAGEKTFYSFTEAALRGQITVKNIKNGIRVEYVIGRMETKYLVPRMITEARFKEYIYEPLLLAVEEGKMTYWDLKKYFTDQETETTGMFKRQDPAVDPFAEKEYPITKEVGTIYVFNGKTSKELTKTEEFIKAFCEDYSYEEMEKDHVQCKYDAVDKNPPNFKMALEYTLDKNGVSVTLPASGIRFNQTLYTLEGITVLPYMGCGSYQNDTTPNDGYIFFPDGSGTIFDFEELANSGSSLNVKGTVYGLDYAYQNLEKLKEGTHKETVRYPVFGIAEEAKTVVSDGFGGTTAESLGTHGFLAVIEEGDSLASITAESGGSSHKYFNVKMEFDPRPKDSYVVADSVSVGSGNEWTVISSRKYTGNYTIKYLMLSDSANSKYEASWLGMANAYRDYLIENEVIEPLKKEELNEDIPLYIESFGTMETVEKVLSVPVTVMTPMTTFEDVETMYNTLKEHGVDNVNFRLTGFANGGMYARVPYKLKWESKVGGKNGFEDLVAFANEVNDTTEGQLGIFPDFDFAYIRNTGLFDGLSNKKHAIKTIDNRYSNKRYYSATKQTYISYFELAISPAYFDHFYNELTENFVKYSVAGDGSDLGISVSSLGTALNSDFDVKDPYNREDSKEYSVYAFEHFADNYGSVMTDGANAYAWKYVDYILNMPLTSSRYLQSSATVPFMGAVLHGFVQYAGAPINMEGNTKYALLKAIENGAGLYFTLSFRNTDILKEDEIYNKYYSIMYNIWVGELNDDGVFEEGELLELYRTLNEALKDLQTANIIDHDFLGGTRFMTEEEIAAEAERVKETVAEKLLKDKEDKEKAIKSKALEGFVAETSVINSAVEKANDLITADIANLAVELENKYNAYNNATEENKDAAFSALREAYTKYTETASAALKALSVIENVYYANQAVKEEGAGYSSSFVYAITQKYNAVRNYAKYFEIADKAGEIVEDTINEELYTAQAEEENAHSYAVSENSIVKVVYGNGDKAEKTFFLNYNYYDVVVDYNGEKITIEAYGFESR